MSSQSPNLPKATVTIVVPMCDEEESIEILREKLELLQQRLSPSAVVDYCLVDDGSTDRTWELMANAVPAGANCIRRRHETNRGLGAAIRTGMQAARGSIVCTVDADCSYSPEDLSTLIDVVISGKADVAVASPYHPEGGVIGVKPWRIMLSRQCSRLYRWCGSLKLHTYTSIFRAYRGTLARQMEFKDNGFVSAVEMLFCADRLGYRICEVPLVLRARQRGYSKIRIARTIWTHFGMMLGLMRAVIIRRFRNTGSVGPVKLGPQRTAAMSVVPQLSNQDRSVG